MFSSRVRSPFGAPVADYATAQLEGNVNRHITVATLVLFSTAVLAAAQTPDQPQTPAPTASQQNPTSVTTTVTTTLVGCLYREDEIPGRTPNVTERAGILEDYILADAATKIDRAEPGATSGTSGTVPASGRMYKIENIPDERLKALLRKKVEVTGRIDPQRAQAPGRPGSATGAPTPDVGPSPDRINLPEFEASSIREISGQCPAKPALRQ
jgi:hypothetical protein